MIELQSKRALVTAAAQGLGRAIAALFIARGTPHPVWHKCNPRVANVKALGARG